jgi:membrane-bound lytic murein transglycosylase A
LISSAPRINPIVADRAWRAFKLSCPALLRRTDQSGLTRAEDWREVCALETRLQTGTDTVIHFPPENIFADRFELVRVGDGKAFATGYFEPEIAGSRLPAPGSEVPVYRTPPDLVRGTFADGTTGRGRYDESGVFVLYHDRMAIDAGALTGQGLEIAYAADAIDLFFLQIQGSGRLRLPDGGVMRIGYDGQNGREYLAIGRIMKERGLLGPGQTSMQGIVGWLRANPEQGRAIMAENKSYVFFKELTGPGPLGSIGVAVTPRASIAVDPRFVPYGAPVMLTLDHAEAWPPASDGARYR